MTLPAKWREGDGGGIDVRVMKHPRQRALELLREEEFQRTLDAVEALEGCSPAEKESYKRRFFSAVQECPVDKQGRLQLPSELVKKVGLAGEVVLAGIGRRIEIWPPDAWAAAEAGERDAFERISAMVTG